MISKEEKKDSLISENLTTTSTNFHFSGVIGPLCTVVKVTEERWAKIFICVNPIPEGRGRVAPFIYFFWRGNFEETPKAISGYLF